MSIKYIRIKLYIQNPLTRTPCNGIYLILTESKRLFVMGSWRKTKLAEKPKLENLIPEYLEGDMKKTALDFVAYMRENKMSPSYRPSLRYKCNYKGKSICTISFPRSNFCNGAFDNEFDQAWMPEDRSKNFWAVIPELHHINEYETLIDDDMKNIIWEKKNIYFCNNCWYTPENPRACAPGKNLSILGKTFENLCGRAFFWFYNPNEATINCIKKLLEYEKQAR